MTLPVTETFSVKRVKEDFSNKDGKVFFAGLDRNWNINEDSTSSTTDYLNSLTLEMEWDGEQTDMLMPSFPLIRQLLT